MRVLFFAVLSGVWIATANPNFYTILGISRDVSQHAVKQAYRQLSLKWHPDRHSEDSRTEAQEMFIGISEAYATLSDEEKRRTYDLSCAAGLAYDGSMRDFAGDADFQAAAHFFRPRTFDSSSHTQGSQAHYTREPRSAQQAYAERDVRGRARPAKEYFSGSEYRTHSRPAQAFSSGSTNAQPDSWSEYGATFPQAQQFGSGSSAARPNCYHNPENHEESYHYHRPTDSKRHRAPQRKDSEMADPNLFYGDVPGVTELSVMGAGGGWKEMVEDNEEHRSILVVFYAPSSARCKSQKPVFESFARSFAASGMLRMGAVDCDSHAARCRKEIGGHIEDLPAVIYYGPRSVYAPLKVDSSTNLAGLSRWFEGVFSKVTSRI